MPSLRKIKIITAAVVLAVFFVPTFTQADQFSDQITALQAQIAQNQATANSLAAQANTLKNTLAEINAQIATATAALNLTKAQVAQTQAQIAQAQAELDQQKALLRANIQIMYQQGDITPLEVLASSSNLSDFVTTQEYLTAIRNKVTDSLNQIEALEKQLQTKNDQLAVQQTQQQGQVSAIAEQQATQQSLLSQTQGQEASYQQIVAQNQSALSAVVAARAAAIRNGNLRVSGGGCGPYPDSWCHAAQDSVGTDGGYPNRECTSYVAYRRETTGHPLPDHWGNAEDWYVNVTTHTPAPGDIAVWKAYANPYIFNFGHVAYVESVDSGGMTISQYNFDIGNGPGFYSTMYVPFGSTMWGGVGFVQ